MRITSGSAIQNTTITNTTVIKEQQQQQQKQSEAQGHFDVVWRGKAALEAEEK